MIEPQWTVEAAGDSAPLTVTVQVAQVRVATENGDQIALAPDQIAP